jgi:hypothetical protein
VFVPPGLKVALSIAVDEACMGVAMLCHQSLARYGNGYRQRLLQGYMDATRLAVISAADQEYTSGHLSSMCNPP